MSLGNPFIQLTEVESTNNYAMAKVQAQLAGHGTAWFARHQTAGKGQRGRKWISAPGENIILSVALDPKPLIVSQQFVVSAMVAVACFDLFNKYCRSDVAIKWPNDIYWKDRKAGGILIENTVRGGIWYFSILGIGLNINQTSFNVDAAKPVSLTQITGKQFDTIEMAKELCNLLDERWNEVQDGKATEIIKLYESRLYKLEQATTFRMQNAVFTATIKGVNALGELLVDANGETAIPVGQVEWLSA